MSRKWLLFFLYFIIILACALRIVTYYAHHYYIVPDEAHSLSGMKESFLYLFTHFEQGANFSRDEVFSVFNFAAVILETVKRCISSCIL